MSHFWSNRSLPQLCLSDASRPFRYWGEKFWILQQTFWLQTRWMCRRRRINADAAVADNIFSLKKEKRKKCAQVLNVGWPYLRDILYVGPLFPAAELSTSLRKCAPAAPGRTQTKSYSLDDVTKVCPCVYAHYLFTYWIGRCVSLVPKQAGSLCFNLSPKTRTVKAKQSLKKTKTLYAPTIVLPTALLK